MHRVRAGLWQVVALSALCFMLSACYTIAGGNGTGSGANQLSIPTGVTVDDVGNVYVSDTFNHRVQQFPAGSTSQTNGVTIAGGNGNGSGANQLDHPAGIAVDGDGNLYVADTFNHRVQQFPAGSTSQTNGVTVAGGNGPGSGANQLAFPGGVAVDSAGNLYVADSRAGRVQRFPAGSTKLTDGVTIAGGNGTGSAANQLNYPYGVAVVGAGMVYVSDSENNRVQQFPAGSTSLTNGVTIAGGNGSGPGANQFAYPVGVAVDGDGNVYVADRYNHRVQRFPAGSTSLTNGMTIVGGGGEGVDANQLRTPFGVAVDDAGISYVADSGNDRVQKVLKLF